MSYTHTTKIATCIHWFSLDPECHERQPRQGKTTISYGIIFGPSLSLTQEGEEPDCGDDGEGAGVVEGRRVGVGVGHRLPPVDGDHRHRERAHQDVRA